MKAYVIATLTIHDPATFAEYRQKLIATVKPFGGTFLAADGKVTATEGQWRPTTVVAEFPSRDAAEGFYKSEAYQAIIDLRLKSASGEFIILDGL